jgi:phospholipid N-methyltransferase
LCEQHGAVPVLAVELHADLAAHLRQRFPHVEVHTAAAHDVLRRLQPQRGAATLVSSLPFRSLPPALRTRSRRAIERFLAGGPEHRLVQYTYLPRAPFEPSRGAPLRWRCVETVWRNVPPAWVWELRADAA